MELSDHLREMLKELGQAINESISGSGRVHDSVQKIRDEGYNLYMVLDAKVGVNKRERADALAPRASRYRGARGGDGHERARRVPDQPQGPALPEVARHRSHPQGPHAQGPGPQSRQVARARHRLALHGRARSPRSDPLRVGGATSPRAGLPRYRGRQIFDAIHRRGSRDYAAMTELPGALRERLAAETADPPARDRAPRGVGRRQRQVRPEPVRRRADRGGLHARLEARSPRSTSSRTPAPSSPRAPRPRSRPRALDASRREIHRLPLVPDRLRGRLRLLRDGPARRAAAISRPGEILGQLYAVLDATRAHDRGPADRLHGNGGAVPEPRRRAPRARDPLRDPAAAAGHRVDLRHHAGLRGVRGAAAAAEPRRVARTPPTRRRARG